MGNNNAKKGLEMYKDWIYCPTCDIKLLVGVDTEMSYDAINGLAKDTTPISVPVAWCHILRADRLHHVNTVALDSDGNVVYTRDEHMIQV